MPSRLVWAKGLFDQHHVGDGGPVRRLVLQIMPYLLNTEREMFCFFFSRLSLLLCVDLFFYLPELKGVDGCGDPGDPCSRLFAGSVSQNGAGVELELNSAKVKEKRTEPEMER
jgi:hypothetical protein